MKVPPEKRTWTHSASDIAAAEQLQLTVRSLMRRLAERLADQIMAESDAAAKTDTAPSTNS